MVRKRNQPKPLEYLKPLIGKKLIAIGDCDVYFEGGVGINMGIENYEFTYDAKDLDPKKLDYYAPSLIKKEK